MGIQKDLWGSFADTYLQGARDPARHDAATLQEFFQQVDAPDVPDMSTAGIKNWAGAPMSTLISGGRSMPGVKGGAGMSTCADPEKQDLVDRIKMFQKESAENQELWGAYCGPRRDPSRHERRLLE